MTQRDTTVLDSTVLDSTVLDSTVLDSTVLDSTAAGDGAAADGRWDEAATHYAVALASSHGHPILRAALGRALNHAGRYRETLDVVGADPWGGPSDDVDILLERGIALEAVGRSAPSAIALERARQIDPTDHEVALRLALVLIQLGRFDDAAPLTASIPRSAPQASDACYLAATFLPADRATGAALVQDIDALLADAHGETRRSLLYGKAHLELQCGQPDRAVRTLRSARTGLARCDRGAHRDRLRRVLDLPGLGGRLADAGPPDAGGPIFLVGLPRCGGSLLAAALDRHPRLGSVGEAGLAAAELDDMVPDLLASPDHVNAALDALPGSGVAPRLAQRAAELIGGGCRPVDKTLNNIELVGAIAMAVPAARFVHLVRQPMDQAVSLYTTHLARAHDYVDDVEDLAWYIAQHRQVAAEWAGLVADRWIEVGYEDLVTRPEATIASLLNELGEEADHRCLVPSASRSPVRTMSASQVRRPIHANSIDRLRIFGDELDDLRSAVLASGLLARASEG